MVIWIDTAEPRAIYLQIVDEVRRGIVLGTLKADDPLPSVRSLAGELKVNPNTVRQAYGELERDGAVYVRRGQGTFIAPVKVGRRDRERLARGVAERALRDAHRHGLDVDDVVTALREATARIEKTGKEQP